MQNKRKITVIASAIALVVLGGGFFLAKKNIDTREQQIAQGFKKLGKILPPNFKQENILVKGLFSSAGIYKINYTEKGKTDSLVIDYKLDHGVTAWFGGDIKFNSTVKLLGESFKEIKIADQKWMLIDGDIQKDGSFNMKGIGAQAVVIAQPKDTELSKLIIEPSNFVMLYNKPSGAVKAELVYPTITISGKESINIKNVKLSTNFNVTQPHLGDLNLKIEQVKDKEIDIIGVDIYGKAELVKDKLDILTSFKAANISILPLAQKDVKLELTYSLKGIDKIALQLYKEMYEQDLKQKEFTSEIKEKFVNGMKQVLKTGMVLSLDKLSVKNDKGFVDFSGAIEMKPSATIQDISFEKKTKLKFDLIINGEFAKMLKAMAPPDQSEMLTFDDKNNIKMSLVFDNGVFKLNGKVFSQEYNDQINTALKGLDAQLKK